MSPEHAKQSLFRKMSCKSKESDYFWFVYFMFCNVVILAYMAKPGDFTEIAYFQWYLKRDKKR